MAHIAAHLSIEELGERYRSCADACTGRHYQAIWLLAQGRRLSEVAATTGFVQRWLEQLASRYNQFGPDALGDRRRRKGAPAQLLTPALLVKLRWQLVDEPIVNKHFNTLAELQGCIEQRCRDLEAETAVLRAATLFHWWPQNTMPN